MPSFERNLLQTATYWAPSNPDLFGKFTYVAPQTLPCRWEDRVELVRNQFGEEVASKSRIFFAAPIVLGGYLFLGTSAVTDPTTVIGAQEIILVATIPDLKNLKKLYVAYL